MAKRPLDNRSKMIQVVIRCDANESTGLGHLVRCKAVAFELTNKGCDVLFLGDYSPVALSLLEEFNYKNVEGFNAADIPSSASLCILDSYCFNQTELDQFIQLPTPLVVIDDFNTLNFSGVELVYNPSIGAGSRNYSATKYLFGARYFPFSPELHEHKVRAKSGNHILVALGGSDLHHVGEQIVADLAIAFPNEPGVWVTASEQKRAFENWRTESPSASIANLLANSKVLVCGGGLLKYEAAYLGIPTVNVHQTNDQREESKHLVDLEMAIDAGVGSDYNSSLLVASVGKALRLDFRRKCMRLSNELFPSDSTLQLARQIVSLI